MSPQEADDISHMNQDDHPGIVVSRPAPRRKRGQYANLACYECKKRKTKCNGTCPCSQCERGGRECKFPPQTPRRRGTIAPELAGAGGILSRLHAIENQIRPLQAQLLPAAVSVAGADTDSISTPPAQHSATINTEPTRNNSIPPPSPRIQTHANSSAPLRALTEHDALPQPSDAFGVDTVEDSPFSTLHSIDNNRGSDAGTTSIYTPATAHYKFNIDFAQTNLLARGIYPPARTNANFTGVNFSRADSPIPQLLGPSEPLIDPIWSIDRVEAARLCDVYEEEINISHPFLDMAMIRDNIQTLYDSIDVLTRHGCAQIPLKGTAILLADDLHIVKLVFAMALITETGGPGSLTKALFDDVKSSTKDKFWEDITISTIVIFFLLFLADNDRLAWRLTGFVSRWCLEIGLNQSRFIQQVPRNDHDRKMAVRLFWCIHALDRRWSFGNGLPFVIQDSDIDKNYPEPDNQVPYLKAMVTFSQIMSAVWYASYSSPIDRSTPQGRDKASYLDFRITKWWEELPADLQLGQHDDQFQRGPKRLRILLYLRRCQLKILLHQPLLHTPRLIQEHLKIADGVVQQAKDIIQKLDELHRSTNIYSTQQMCFNYFLVLSLGVIFLAISQAPDRYVHAVQTEFHTALDLIESLSSNSYVSRRLWYFVRILRPLGDRLGVKCTDKSAQAVEVGEDHQMAELAQNSCKFDPKLFCSTEETFTQLFDEPIDTVQLMESMKSIFDAVEAEWGQESMQD